MSMHHAACYSLVASLTQGNPADILRQKRLELARSKSVYPPTDDIERRHDLVIQVGTVLRFQDQVRGLEYLAVTFVHFINFCLWRHDLLEA